MTTFNRKPLSLALLAVFSTGYCGVSGGALLNLSPVPLFVTSATKANVLLIYSNSNAMDEDPTGFQARLRTEVQTHPAQGGATLNVSFFATPMRGAHPFHLPLPGVAPTKGLPARGLEVRELKN